MAKKILFLILSVAGVSGTFAQELGDVAFRQALLDLETGLRMMCVAAHPDDEDGATLAYYRMLHGVETHAVIATRGEGGQNEIGPELYKELGVIRTREMKAAAEIEGAELHFLNLPEFGYSKSSEETFEKWGRDVAIERMVRLVREVRPHVIITNHGRMKDHGHHQAIGAVLQEAFDLAGDPEQFPEHRAAGLAPWRALRLYIREFRGGEGTIPTNISRLEPIRGMTIAEIAASALEVHESQGMRFFIDLLLSSQPRAYYHLVKNTRGKPGQTRLKDRGPLFDGMIWEDVLERPLIDTMRSDRAEALPVLLSWLTDHDSYREGEFDEQRLWAAVNQAAIAAAELRLRATSDDDTVTPGQMLKVSAKLQDFGERDAIEAVITLDEIQGLGDIGKHKLHAPLHKTGNASRDFEFEIPAASSLTLPLAPRLFSPGFLAPQLSVEARVKCGDATLHLSAPVYVDVANPLTIECPDAPYLLRAGVQGPQSVRLLVTNNTSDPLSENVVLSGPEDWTLEPQRMPVSFSREGEQRFVAFTVTPPADHAIGDISLLATVAGSNENSEVTIRSVDLAVPENARVGVIQSYDNTFVKTLEKLGVPHETLTTEDYVAKRLDAFSTIVVDIRAYQYRPDLVANNATLLDFVARGGTLLVMYQKTFDWKEEYAPYPITLSRNRVTREDAPITILAPEHPLFTTPNAISTGDWHGWIQERGLYFPNAWHEAYTPLLQTQDPGEDIPAGGYLVARHGEGHYVYSPLGWYRQLRELHPGALRCFSNMLAL